MPNSEKVLPCYRCGGTRFLHKLAPQHEQVFCANCYAYTHEEPIHPNRLKAENLVPASELEALVKVAIAFAIDEAVKLTLAEIVLDDGIAEIIGRKPGSYMSKAIKNTIKEYNNQHRSDTALAHAREILEGGKG